MAYLGIHISLAVGWNHFRCQHAGWLGFSSVPGRPNPFIPESNLQSQLSAYNCFSHLQFVVLITLLLAWHGYLQGIVRLHRLSPDEMEHQIDVRAGDLLIKVIVCHTFSILVIKASIMKFYFAIFPLLHFAREKLRQSLTIASPKLNLQAGAKSGFAGACRAREDGR